ncbi:hypothetical protein C0J52_06282 [Blattella germanica]|nr:hypothetical protein C0J52_06282 [Blattella germanica]
MNTGRAVLHNCQQAVADIQCLSQNLQPVQTTRNSKEKCSMYHWLHYFESQGAYLCLTDIGTIIIIIIIVLIKLTYNLIF